MASRFQPREINRPPQSREELASIPPASGECRRFLRDRGNTLSPETLVHMTRQAWATGDRSLAEQAGLLLYGNPTVDGRFEGGFSEAMIRAHARTFGFSSNADDLAEYRARCYEALWEAITAGSERKPFWEERFYPALKSLVIDVGRSLAAEKARHRLDDLTLDEEFDLDVPATTDQAHDLLSRRATQEIKDAIRDLRPDLRAAAWLAWVEDWQIESKNPADTKTVAAALGISGRMVRKRLRAAVESLRQDPRIVGHVEEYGW